MLGGRVQMAGWDGPGSTTSASLLALTFSYMSAVSLGCTELSASGQLSNHFGALGFSRQTHNAMPHALIARSVDSLTVGEQLLCRLWYLNISELGTHFTGATLHHFLMAWGTAKLQGMGTAPTSLR